MSPHPEGSRCLWWSCSRVVLTLPLLVSEVALGAEPIAPFLYETDRVSVVGQVGSVATDGGGFLVGAPSWQGGECPPSEVAFFQRVDESWAATIFDPSTCYSDFGRSADMTGSLAAVGAPGRKFALLFEREETGAWTWVGGVKGPGPPDNPEMFAQAVAIDGETLVVGQPARERVFVYRRTGPTSWDEEQLLFGDPADPQQNTPKFGEAVAVDGLTIAVGAPEEDTCGASSRSGAVYFFAFDAGTWVRTRKLPRPCQMPGFFGWDVHLDLPWAIVGSLGNGQGDSSAFVIEKTVAGWGEPLPLVHDFEPMSGFGLSVAISGDRALVGAPGYAGQEGAAYLFERSTAGWLASRILRPRSAFPPPAAGQHVDLAGTLAVLGGSSNTAYVYDLDLALFSDGFESGDASAWSLQVP